MGSWKEFFKWYLRFDMKDITNYIAIAVACYLFYWGIKTIIASASFKP